jgi:hypothetical protein
MEEDKSPRYKLHFNMYGYTDLERVYGVGPVARVNRKHPIRTRLDNVKALLAAPAIRFRRT